MNQRKNKLTERRKGKVLGFHSVLFRDFCLFRILTLHSDKPGGLKVSEVLLCDSPGLFM